MSQNNQKEGEHYVVDGAIYKCQQGAIPCQISVVSQPKVTAENKAMVNDGDVTFASPTAPFATCKLNMTPNGPGPCTYSNGKWKPNTLLTHGSMSAVVESSTMICPIGGEISCVYHGQVQSVTAEDYKELGLENQILSPFCFVFTMPEDGVERKTAAIYSVAASKLIVRPNDTITLYAYKKQKKELCQTELVNLAVTTRKVVEVEQKGKSPVKETYIDKLMLYKKVCSPFNISLPEPGFYHIEGGSDNMVKHYTKTNYKTKKGTHISFDQSKPITSSNNLPSDKGCEVIVEVLQYNRIQSISLSGDYIKGDGADSYILKSSDEVKIIVHTAVPLNGDEQLRLMIDKHLTQDVAVEMPKMISVIADTDCSSYYFTLKPSFFNNRNCKKIDVILTEGKQTTRINYFNSGLLDSKSLIIKEVEGYVSACVAHDIFGQNPIPKDSYVRPGTTICLTASPSEAYNKSLDLKDAVWEIVENNVSQEPKPKGSLAFHKLNTEGKTTIKLDLSKCNVVINNKDLGVTKYEHTFNVSSNVIKGIVDAPKRLYPDIKYSINFDLLYEFDSQLDKPLKFQLDDKEKELTSNTYDVLLETVGKHSLKYGKKGVFEFEVISPSVKNWQFSDDRKNRINEVGLDETFYLDIDIPAWADYQKNVLNVDGGIGKVQFYLWQNKVGKADPIAIASLKNAKMGNDGKAHIALKISKDELANHLDSYQFPEKVGIIASLTNPPYAALELLVQKNGYPGHWVYNNAIPLTLVTQPCVTGFFSGKSGNPQKSVMKYGDSMFIMLLTHNCQNQLDKITVELVENDKKGETDDRVVAVYSNLGFDENGKVKIDISGDVKEDDHGENPNPRLFYFRVYLDGKQIYTYPQSPAEVYNMTYKEAEGKSETAEVEIDGESYSMSKSDDSCDYESALKIRSYLWQLKVGKDKEIERLNRTLAMMAPVVVGEELRKGEKLEKNTRCFCNRDFTVDEVREFITVLRGSAPKNDEIWENSDVDDKSISSFTNELNIACRKYGINKCIQKITFLVQAASETANFTCSEEKISESVNEKKYSGYKGRGLLHLTFKSTYEKYNQKVAGVNIVDDKQYISKNLHYIVDAGATYFTNPKMKVDVKWDKNDKTSYLKERALKFKESVEIKKLLTLNDLCLLMEIYDEEKYFFLISVLLNGYTKGHVHEAPKVCLYDKRLSALNTLKKAFKYDKTVCKEVEADFPIYSTEWHDPLDVMQICAYTQSGRFDPYNATFHLRKTDEGLRPHQGVDLFALEGTPVYACLDGVVEKINENPSTTVIGSGNAIWIKVSDPTQVELLKKRKKSNFKSFYNGKEEVIYGSGFNEDSESFYLVYYHLHRIDVMLNDHIKAGAIIGYSGVTGAQSTKGPHLHFEIRSALGTSGLSSRCNPGLYMDYEQYKTIKDKNDGKTKIEILKIDGTKEKKDVNIFESEDNEQYKEVSRRLRI